MLKHFMFNLKYDQMLFVKGGTRVIEVFYSIEQNVIIFYKFLKCQIFFLEM